MRSSRMVLTLLVVCALLGGSVVAHAFPDREVRVVIPYGPGGLSDLSFRTFAQVWEPLLGVNVMVLNRAGGGGLVGGEYVASSAADGYTLGYLSGRQTFPEIYAAQYSYDSSALIPVFQVIFGLPAIAVRANAPWQSLEEFVAYAQDNPGLQYASTGRGATPHLAAEHFAAEAGIVMEDVPYGGDADALVALMSGDVSVAFLNFPAAIAQMEAGNIRLLAVHAPEAQAGVPTFIEQGLDMSLGVLTYVAVFAPAGVPEEAVALLADTAEQAFQDAEMVEQLSLLGTYPHFSAGEDFAETLAAYRDIVGQLILDLDLFQD